MKKAKSFKEVIGKGKLEILKKEPKEINSEDVEIAFNRVSHAAGLAPLSKKEHVEIENSLLFLSQALLKHYPKK